MTLYLAHSQSYELYQMTYVERQKFVEEEWCVSSDASLPSCAFLVTSGLGAFVPVRLCDCIMKLASRCLLLATLTSLANQPENKQHNLHCIVRTARHCNVYIGDRNKVAIECNQVCKSILKRH